MASMKIIGITGRARSGKDTFAGMILNIPQYGERMSFAAPIREFVAKITGIPLTALLDGPLKEQPIPEFGGRSPRQMMQTLGTEWGRDLIDRDLWITVARKHLERLAELPVQVRPTVVFSDVRFENEASMIRELGGTIVHIHRDDAEAVNAHASEQGIERASDDVLVYNDGDLGDLRWWAERVYTHA